MRFLSADFIFPISSNPVPNGVLVVSANGMIKDVLQEDDENAPEASRIERFAGILCPGFVNAHCHLELSHMKNVVAEKTGLPKFITEIVTRREENAEEKSERIAQADEEMWRNGIQAVGDICNTADTLETKRASKIAYHSFVEVFSFDPLKAGQVLHQGVKVAEVFKHAGLKVTIVPHAPYSVSESLFQGIRRQQAMFPGPISMHNQETESEDEMFVSGTGALVETFKGFGADFSDWNPQKRSALDYALPQLPEHIRLMLVHNTCTTPDEMQHALEERDGLFWCACPNANLYIENRVPNIPAWLAKGASVCIGTDSLASNHQLSVLNELQLIQKHHRQVMLPELLKMATLNGACALNMEQEKGSFQKGKLPGVLWLKDVDTRSGDISSASVQRII
ncbi:MAG: hypothetical protein RL266_1910 [Bacteroidota bacterium]|jgi:cytosine/adenosine deaminase-related metal-dependent hydrolase